MNILRILTSKRIGRQLKTALKEMDEIKAGKIKPKSWRQIFDEVGAIKI